VWQGNSYVLLIPIHKGSLTADTPVASAIGIHCTGTHTAPDAEIRLSERPAARPFDGFGGNYCFQYDTPATNYTLEHLQPVWLRTELDLAHWEPENDNADPSKAEWRAFGNPDDTPELAKRFQLYRKLVRAGGPTIASIWTAPEWLFEHPGKGFWINHRRIPEERWPELVECIGTYLEETERTTGLTPDCLSFNEPCLGIRIQFSATELARVCSLLATDLKSRGLKTRILLGDVASPRALSYARDLLKATKDQGIYGAIGFHTWGGATPEDYRGWAEFADETGLPLLATEVGLDGTDYKTPWVFASHNYALREAALYADLLNSAGVAGTVHWEYTPDYELATVKADGVSPNNTRIGQIKQFRQLTPVNSRHLQVLVSNPDTIRACALAGGKTTRDEFTLHVVNQGGACRLRVAGIPDGIAILKTTTTDMNSTCRKGKETRVADGKTTLTLPARSLTSLSSLPHRARD